MRQQKRLRSGTFAVSRLTPLGVITAFLVTLVLVLGVVATPAFGEESDGAASPEDPSTLTISDGDAADDVDNGDLLPGLDDDPLDTVIDDPGTDRESADAAIPDVEEGDPLTGLLPGEVGLVGDEALVDRAPPGVTPGIAPLALRDLTPSVLNPQMPQRCGVDAAIVLDLSGSVDSREFQQSKNAAYVIIDALAASRSGVGIYTFATYAPAVSGQNQVWMPLRTPTEVAAAKAHVDGLQRANSSAGGTNWEGALKRVADSGRTYDFVYFITDGVPTANDNYSAQGETRADRDAGFETHFSDIDNAIQAANQLKIAGSYLVPVAVGVKPGNVSVREDNRDRQDHQQSAQSMLQRIAVPVVEVADYDELEAKLNEVLSPCQATVIVEKQIVDQDGTVLETGAPEYRAQGWEFTISDLPAGFTDPASLTVDTGQDGLTPQVEFETDTPSDSGTITITETVRDGYRLFPQDGQNAVCRIGDGINYTNVTGWQAAGISNDGDNGLTTDVEAGRTTHCIVQNQEIPAKAAIEKGPRPGAPVQADANGHADLVYTVKVSNTDELAADTGEILETVLLPENVVARENITVGFESDDGVVAEELIQEIPAGDFVEGAQLPLVSNLHLPSNTTATFTITVPVQVNATSSEEWEKLGECVAGEGGTYSGGVPNGVSMENDSDGPENNTACIPILEMPAASVTIVKENHDGEELPGARFALYAAELDGAGAPVGPGELLIAELSNPSENGASFVIDDLSAGYYYLLELESPAGYSLLPAPIGFELDVDENREFSLRLIDEASQNHVVQIDEGLVLRVADTTSGDLPASGGPGAAPYVLLAALILGLGLISVRKLGVN